MRRVFLPVLLVTLLGAAAGRAQDVPSLLGSSGEVYRVLRGSYRDLFPAAPPGQLVPPRPAATVPNNRPASVDAAGLRQDQIAEVLEGLQAL